MEERWSDFAVSQSERARELELPLSHPSSNIRQGEVMLQIEEVWTTRRLCHSRTKCMSHVIRRLSRRISKQQTSTKSARQARTETFESCGYAVKVHRLLIVAVY